MQTLAEPEVTLELDPVVEAEALGPLEELADVVVTALSSSRAHKE